MSLRRFAAAAFLLAVAQPATVATASAATTSTVSVSASDPGGPIVSGIAGQGYFAGISNVTATNPASAPSARTSFKVEVPVDTATASFSVTSTLPRGSCKMRVARGMQVWNCPVPAMAAGATIPVATIIGSEDAQTGLPATVVATVVGPDAATTTRTWKWVLPYSHLSATWSSLPSSADWGSAVGGTLTITNDGIWGTQSLVTVAIRPADPAAYNGDWLGYSNVSGYSPYYCGVDSSSGAADGLSCSLDPLAPGVTQTIQVTAYPASPTGGPLTMLASDSTGNFSVPSPQVDVIGTGAALTWSISNPPTVEADTTFARTYTVTNTGSTEALGVSLTDGAYAFKVESTTGAGSCVYASGYRVGGRINCSFGTVPAGASVTLVATLLAPAISGSQITYSNGVFGSTTSPFVASGGSLATSNSVTVFNQPVANVVAPTLSGTAQVGQTLTATWGSWTGTGPLILWAKLVSIHDGGQSDISTSYTNGTTTSGAPSTTAFSYTTPSSEVGDQIELQVYAQNYDNEIVTTSVPLGPVQP